MIITMEIYAAPKLSKYMAALSAYNIKSLTYEINQHTHAHAHTHRHTPCTCVCALTDACTHKHLVRNSYRRKYVRETRVEG